MGSCRFTWSIRPVRTPTHRTEESRTIKPVGPLTVSIRLEQAPKSITMQPEGKSLDITWANGRATVTVPQLDLYSILVVEP